MVKTFNQRISVKASKVNLSNVHQNDRTNFRKILEALYKFDKTIPNLEFDIIPQQKYYVLIVQGWNRSCSIFNLKKTFLSTTREDCCKAIDKLYCNFSPSSGIGPVYKLEIMKRKN